MIKGFHGLVMFSLDYSKIGWILLQKRQENFERDTGQKMFISWGSKHMKDWKQALIQSLKLPNFFFDNRLSMYWQNAFENRFGRQKFLGLRKDNPSMAGFWYNNNPITDQKNSNQSLMVMLLIVAWLP